MSSVVEGSALKRGRFKGVWRERYFVLGQLGGEEELEYWESAEARASGAKRRGSLTVLTFRRTETPDHPYALAIRGSPGGVLGHFSEEWLAFPTAEDLDRWIASLTDRSPKQRRRSGENIGGEAFEPDDEVWAEVEASTTSAKKPEFLSAVVYDYSVVRSGWRVTVCYHVQVTELSTAEPWSVRRTHVDFQRLVSEEFEDFDEAEAATPGVATSIARRIALLNDLLAKILREEADSEALADFLRRPGDIHNFCNAIETSKEIVKGDHDDDDDDDDDEEAATLGFLSCFLHSERTPSPLASGVVALASAALSSRVYAVPGALLVALFATGFALGAQMVLAHHHPRKKKPPPALVKAPDDRPVVVEEPPEDHLVSPNLAPWPSPTTTGGHCWSRPVATSFRVRGSTYLVDRVKVASAPPLLEALGVDLFLTDVPQPHIARHPGAFIELRRELRKTKGRSTFALNFCMPWGNFVVYWAFDAPTPGDAASRAFAEFLEGDDEYRDARLKLIPRVVDGNWLVRRAVGAGSSAAKLSEALKLSYFKGSDYFEVDCDIVGSPLARRILSVVRSATSTLVLDLALVIEGLDESELPERILGAVRLHRVDPRLAPVLEPLNSQPAENDDDEDDD